MARRKVIVSLLDEHQEFQQYQAADARAAGARLDLEVELLWAGHDPAAQLRQISRAVSGPAADRPVAVVMEPATAAGLDEAGRAAARAGVGFVTLGDRAPAVEALRAEFPGTLLATVGTDNDEIGRLQAELFRALLPRGGKILYVEGPSFSHAAIHRRKSMQAALRGTDLEVVATLAGGWSAPSAEQAARVWARPHARAERPDLVGSQNDEMAVGVRRALLELRPGWAGIPYTGVDGLPGGGQRLVREKVLAATIITPPPTGHSIELVARALRGEETPAFSLVQPRLFQG
jgi:ABC-type sugar transport system substrate-binding protein